MCSCRSDDTGDVPPITHCPVLTLTHRTLRLYTPPSAFICRWLRLAALEVLRDLNIIFITVSVDAIVDYLWWAPPFVIGSMSHRLLLIGARWYHWPGSTIVSVVGKGEVWFSHDACVIRIVPILHLRTEVDESRLRVNHLYIYNFIRENSSVYSYSPSPPKTSFGTWDCGVSDGRRKFRRKGIFFWSMCVWVKYPRSREIPYTWGFFLPPPRRQVIATDLVFHTETTHSHRSQRLFWIKKWKDITKRWSPHQSGMARRHGHHVTSQGLCPSSIVRGRR